MANGGGWWWWFTFTTPTDDDVGVFREDDDNDEDVVVLVVVVERKTVPRARPVWRRAHREGSVSIIVFVFVDDELWLVRRFVVFRMVVREDCVVDE